MRADRLLSLMLLLHARGRMTAQTLAEHLEVSERTIYRDIDALSSAGVPVYTQSGVNGGVFLDEDYRISLTGLSRDEVRALFVLTDAGPLADLGLGQAVQDTLLKLFAALPDVHRRAAEQVRERFYVDPTNWFQIVEPSSVFPVLHQAVWEDRCVEVIYHAVEGQPEARILEAHALVAKANIWYLVGRRPGGDMRNYRVSRFQQAELGSGHFERDPAFDLAAYWRESCQRFEQEMRTTFPPYTALLRVHQNAFWYFPGFMAGRYEKIDLLPSDDWWNLRVTFDSIEDARTRVLGLGTHAEVLEPDTLRQAVIEMAQAVTAFYAN
ncbi:MAG: helix-turn-helix transcriptional regulator [Phototrophicaceae bacterium]